MPEFRKNFYASLVGKECIKLSSENSLRVLSVYQRTINILAGKDMLISFVKDTDQMSVFSVHIPEIFYSIPYVKLKTLTGEQAYFDNDRWFLNRDLSIVIGGAKIWESSPMLHSIKDRIKKSSLFFDYALFGKILKIFIEVSPYEGFACLPVLVFRDLFRQRDSVFKGYIGKGRNFRVEGDRPLMGKLGIERGECNTDKNRYVECAVEVVVNNFTEMLDKSSLYIDLSGLVGLGIGFTPSGDDFVMGSLLGESLFGTLLGERSVTIDRDRLRERLGSTTYGGKTLLVGAINGNFPLYILEGLDRLLLVLTAPDSGIEWNRVGNAIEMIISHGSTSGADALSGFLFSWGVWLFLSDIFVR